MKNIRKNVLCHTDNRGFTLIELAVVLVIIGFLVAGIVVGQSLIRSAELREVVRDYDHYNKSIKEFVDKYQALPGDMSNAQAIWGADSGCPTTTTNTTRKIATCNGTGNGRIGASSTAGVLDTTYAYEWFRAWQMLSNAGLIEGKFTGVKESATNGDAGIGLNVPQAKTKEKAGWTLYYFLLTTTDTNLWGDNYGHVLAFGGDTTSITNSPILTPDNAMDIDKKIDDGAPGTGIVRARRTASETNCTATDSSQTAATYNTAYTQNLACSLLFILGF